MSVLRYDPRVSQDFQVSETKGVVLLLGFIRSEKFISVSGQVRITLWNHTEDCHIH